MRITYSVALLVMFCCAPLARANDYNDCVKTVITQKFTYTYSGPIGSVTVKNAIRIVDPYIVVTNTCNVDLEVVHIWLKCFDSEGNRIGDEDFYINDLVVGEKFKRLITLLPGAERVEVRDKQVISK
jgi:hypothetical protein